MTSPEIEIIITKYFAHTDENRQIMRNFLADHKKAVLKEFTDKTVANIDRIHVVLSGKKPLVKEMDTYANGHE